MNLREYQLAAAKTCPNLRTNHANFMHMSMGMFTELAEILDILKKNFVYDKPIDKIHVGEEIGDLAWYLANYSTWMGETLPTYIVEKDYVIDLEDSESVIYTVTDLFERIPTYNGTSFPIGFWDLYELCLYFKLDFYLVLAANIAKLKARYPDKFDSEKAVHRDIKAEREVLESANMSI